MTQAADTQDWQEPAAQVERFVTRFGKESYRQLARYAALPLVLTPELVHYLRIELLHYLRIELLQGEDVPWEAEVDLLLSDLCSQVGYELYAMDTQVRAYLLNSIKGDPVWQQRMRKVAQVLIRYVDYLSRLDPKHRQREREAQRLAAMTYIGDDECQQAALEIAERLKRLGDMTDAGNPERGIRAELAYLTRLTQELAPQLQKTPALVEFAQLVQRLLRRPYEVDPFEVSQTFRVGDVELRPSPRLLPDDLARLWGPSELEGFPPLETLDFETGKLVPRGSDFPPLLPQTVDVVTLVFNEGPVPPEPAAEPLSAGPVLFDFSFEVATIRRDGSTGNPWIIDRRTETAQLYEEQLGAELGLDIVAIPGGNFVMGSPEDEPEREPREEPQHEVTVPDFYMGRYPVTQAQWRFVAELPQVARELNLDPSQSKGADRPVESVSWHDAVEFCARLSQFTGRNYRLPSEAEWEYACRADTTTPFHFGETLSPELANYNGSNTYNNGPEGIPIGEPTPVRQFGLANVFGLCDMHGNVFEWCQDQYHDSYKGAPTDGSAWEDRGANEDVVRILRGGSWYYLPWHCRSAYRYTYIPRKSLGHIGFRVVCSAPRALP